jgi:hypothetical protein
VFPRTVLGCAVAGVQAFAGGIPGPFGKILGEFAGSVSFRAAAAANMCFRPLDGEFSFEWKLGRLFWLPRKDTAEKSG